MTTTLDELKDLRREMQKDISRKGEVLSWLLDVEIRRRDRSGRPKSDTPLIERNREAQQRCREQRKIHAAAAQLSRDRSERRARKRQAKQEFGIDLKLKRKKPWQRVPKVPTDGLKRI